MWITHKKLKDGIQKKFWKNLNQVFYYSSGEHNSLNFRTIISLAKIDYQLFLVFTYFQGSTGLHSESLSYAPELLKLLGLIQVSISIALKLGIENGKKWIHNWHI
jgi:hypothetical protein